MDKRDKTYWTKYRAARKAAGLCPGCGGAYDSEKHERHLAKQGRPPLTAQAKATLRARRGPERIRRHGRIAALRLLLGEVKSRTGCACGERHAACLEFHHRDQSQKEAGISALVAKLDLVGIVAELAKCDVVCANCHKKHHYETRTGPWTRTRKETADGTPEEG
jgi:hypothetical protein